ncbi:MAG: response regulator transcription factor [Dermatophilaceae bacterium]
MTIGVVVAEDEPLVRSGILALLDAATDIRCLAEAENGQQAAELVARLRPDVLVTDLRMPVVDGVDLLLRMGTEPDAPAALVLTSFDSDPDVHRAVRAGAKGYLLKASAPRHLADAIRALAAGAGWVDPSVAGHLLAAVCRAPEASVSAPARVGALTEREREVLVLLSRGLSNAEIAASLWLGHGTVKTHVSRILHKTGCRDRAQAVALAFACGAVGVAP